MRHRGDGPLRTRSTIRGGESASCALVLLAVLALLVAAPFAFRPMTTRAQPVAAEPDVESAMIERIARFVVWPEEARLDEPGTPFEVVVLGTGALYPRLRAVFSRGRDGRSVRVRQVNRLEEVGSPHVLVIEDDWAARVATVVARFGASPILLVGHAPCLASRGVAVNLVRDGRNLRFEVNRHALARSGLRASFHLLRLAQTPREGCG